MAAAAATPHVAMLPSPGMGHLIPMAEFARNLVERYHFKVTFLTLDNSQQANSVIDSLPAKITSIPLPTPSLTDVSTQARIETRISLLLHRSLPSLRDVIRRLKVTTRLVALVVDLFGTDAFDVAEELGVGHYIFLPTSAFLVTFVRHTPELDREVEGECRDRSDPVRLPGCVPIHGKDLLDPVQDRNNEAYSWIMQHTKRYKDAEAIIVNSCRALEPSTVEELTRPGSGKPAIYPVGPLINAGSNKDDPAGCLKWLDSQPTGSVIFVSFGSGGTLPLEQLTELAFGLETSRQRFLWVVRSPNKRGDSAFFTVNSQEDPFAFLPEGFLERTKGVGMVVPSWAPQIAVLNHRATGGFLTHCGWNSTLESIVHGVPMITWPLYAEQKMNAVMLSEKIKVGIRPRVNEENGLVEREEISRTVRELMEGEEGQKVRNRVKVLQDDAQRGLDVGGSSYVAFADIANEWNNIATTVTVATDTDTDTATDTDTDTATMPEFATITAM